MRKTFKYRLLANQMTLSKADNWLRLCRNLYNCCLEERKLAYKMQQVSLSGYDQANELPEIKEAFPEYKEIGSQVLQEVIERLNKAYQAFFRRIKNGEKAGFPRFKGKDRYDSFILKNTGWKLEGKYLTIRNLGRFKLRLSREIEGDIKTITIRKESDKWYACFSCDNVSEKKLEPNEKTIGLDVGIKTFIVDSDGHEVENPKYSRRTERLLRVRQRQLCRRKKGSNRRNKAKVLVSKAHTKIRNQRNDFLHKTANYYIQNYGTISIENLNVKGMVRNHHLAKSISDSAWAKFFELLSYKAEEAGRVVVKIPRFEPSSKTCSACGAINQDLKLSDRQWVCQSCGTLHDRDFNAAKNIQRFGQNHQELTYVNRQCVS